MILKNGLIFWFVYTPVSCFERRVYVLVAGKDLFIYTTERQIGHGGDFMDEEVK